MEIEIDKNTLKQTLHCESDFKCLKNDLTCLCKVENCFNGEIHYIKCADNFYCNYKMLFGSSTVCTCPVRREIYNKYKI
jgi:hypothetical protein